VSVVRELAIVWLVTWGAAFVALAAVGLLRMPDLYSRLHAASKASALGIACLAIALVIQFEDPELGVRAVALGLFLFITAPISTHLIARAGFVTGTPLADEYIVDETKAHRSADPD
jgi:multicomponent Na+:H+ antiporter subunit G